MDSWTQEHSSSSLTVEKFEQTMEFLEENSRKKVPSLDMLMSRKLTKKREAEAIFQYWVDKRLKTRKRLIPEFKRMEKPGSHDPYVAFRPCEEKIKTRKNRAAEYNKYSMLLHIKSLITIHAKRWKVERNREVQRHYSLVKNLEEFSAQYKSNSFDDGFLEWSNWPPSGNEAERVEEPQSSEDEYEPTVFDFEHAAEQRTEIDYLKPIESNIPDDEPGFYRISPSDLIRRRVGRGGRIVLDRRTKSSYSDNNCDTFKSININPAVECSNCSFLPKGDMSSVFRLKDSGTDENIECNVFEVEFEEN